MYTVELNNEKIHELDVNSPKRLSAGVLAEEVNQIPSFSFTIPVMNPAFSQEPHDRLDIVKLRNTKTGEYEFEGHLLTHQKSMTADGKLCIKAVAEGYLGYLCDSIQMYHNYVDTSPEEFLTAVLDAHNAQVTAEGHPEKCIIPGVINITKSDYKRSKTTAYRNTLEEIRTNLIDRIGGEIRVRRVNGSLVLDYLDRIGVDCGTTIEVAKNMKSLTVDVDTSNIVTRLIPLGMQLAPGESAERLTISEVNDGLPYIDDADAIAKYGIIVGTVEFDDITIAENLKAAGESYLANNNRIRRAYECQPLDLSLIDETQQALRCGNSYIFINSFIGLHDSLRLIGRTVDIYKPWTPKLKIGDKSVCITDVASRTAKLVEYELPKQRQELLSAARDIATNIINAGINGHVVVNGNEILIMDTPDKSTATKVWRWNSGGFGYSSNGYDGPYETAITMDGSIIADFIVAGVLRGLEILNGDGKFHVYPDGTVDAAAINITGGSINITTENGSQDLIQLKFQNNSISINPSFIHCISSHNSEAVSISGTGISFYPHLELGGTSSDPSIRMWAETGKISLEDIYFARESGGDRYSLAGYINNIISRLESLEGK